MAPKGKYGYARSQIQPDLSQLRNVNLPPKLKCHYCTKNLGQANYSQKQLDEVRTQIKSGGTIVRNPKCNKCAGGRLFEFDCVMCHKTGGEADFSKTQRKTPDNAKCYACIEAQVKQEPVNEEDYEDPGRAFLTGLHSQGEYPDYFAPKQTSDASIDEYDQYGTTDNGKEGGIDLSNLGEALIEGDFNPPPNNHSNPWRHSGPQSYQTNSNAMSRVTPSAASLRETSVSNTTGAVKPLSSTTNRSGFAKIKAYKPEQEAPCPMDSSSDSDNYDSDDDDDDGDIEDHL